MERVDGLIRGLSMTLASGFAVLIVGLGIAGAIVVLALARTRTVEPEQAALPSVVPPALAPTPPPVEPTAEERVLAMMEADAQHFAPLSGDELAVALEDWAAVASDTTYAMLERNADAHAGERAVFQGTIAEIHDLPDGGSMLRLATSSYGRDVVWVETFGSCAADPHLVADSRARVYGYLAGAHTYATQAGWTMTIPAFVAVAVVPASVPRHVSAAVRRRLAPTP